MPHNHLDLHIHVVELDIPFIIDLDILNPHQLIVRYVENQLESMQLGLKLSLTYKRGHVFLYWDVKSVMLKRSELTRLHVHFMHPAADLLLELIRRASPSKVSESVKRILDQITAACKTYCEFKSQPIRFKASIFPDRLVFKQSISIDLLWLDEKPVLHVIDGHTNFRNGLFLR